MSGVPYLRGFGKTIIMDNFCIALFSSTNELTVFYTLNTTSVNNNNEK